MSRGRIRPGYVDLARRGELSGRARRLATLLEECTVCPRECRVDRRSELGACATGAAPVVASYHAHFGEEPAISARRGSGTLFMANCNLQCVFCQNHDISQPPTRLRSRASTVEEVASMFLDLQDRGCHNINWVSPTHQVPQLVASLAIAANRGLSLPIVYNTNAYDSVAVLRLLDGIVDVYMPDLKYADPEIGCRLSGVADYPRHARAAITEMFHQVGDSWAVGPEGELQRGLLVRMLVLPGAAAGVEQSLAWIARTLSPQVSISLLAQYRPAHRVPRSPVFASIDRPVSSNEWREAVSALERHMVGSRHYVQGTNL